MENLNITNTDTIESLTSEIIALEKNKIESQDILNDSQKNIDNFTDNNDPMLHQIYDDMLDECYSDQFENITFIHLSSASNLLAEYDPIAYRCGFSDWLDGFDLNDISEYHDLVCEVETQEEIIESLDEEIEELNDLINDMKEEDQE